MNARNYPNYRITQELTVSPEGDGQPATSVCTRLHLKDREQQTHVIKNQPETSRTLNTQSILMVMITYPCMSVKTLQKKAKKTKKPANVRVRWMTKSM